MNILSICWYSFLLLFLSSSIASWCVDLVVISAIILPGAEGVHWWEKKIQDKTVRKSLIKLTDFSIVWHSPLSCQLWISGESIPRLYDLNWPQVRLLNICCAVKGVLAYVEVHQYSSEGTLFSNTYSDLRKVGKNLAVWEIKKLLSSHLKELLLPHWIFYSTM